ncbi:MAG: thiamine-phosphate kinase [Myxococcota bacterium]|nr:thiamine-phosphate kinase [Myxococcota bacterium]
MSEGRTEEELIQTILSLVPHPETPEGPGDDAAVLERSAEGSVVVTTDLMVEGVHFLREHPPAWVGTKLLAANLSDLSAMGAQPQGFVLSAALVPEVHGDWWDRFSRGLGRFAERWGASLTGGDVVRAQGGIGLGITAWGRTVSERVLTRDAGEPGDQLMALGPVGRSEAGLRLWREMAQGRKWGGEELHSIHPAIHHHLAPEPDLDAGPWSLENGAHAAMDLSDGLLVDAPRLARASGVRLEVNLDRLPADSYCSELSLEERAAGGEDYALMVLVPPTVVTVFEGRGFTHLGRAAHPQVPGDPEVTWLIDGSPVTPSAEPFRHFRGQ